VALYPEYPRGAGKGDRAGAGGADGKPEEIGAAVVWLCSDTAAFVVGHAMVIDGGQTL
jgi:NAD(P)-dependent dehydrogenase (short-subunit alcohol dehydrogenase family)